MANFIIGTAGHIDHGKTTVIKKLTNIETDRWEEEKKRGITIDLGFAYFDLPSGVRAGIIDVPGHERFIKNMLAGISGIDLVLLIVAADEGIMPQTQEHLDILDILGIENGIIVLNKCDMVDEEWIEVVEEEISEKVKGTFLEDAKILRVSALTGDGFKELISNIDEFSKKIGHEEIDGIPRIPIDRSFSVTGFGTVITGTLIEGVVNLGDKLEIYPKEIETKVKNIQVHGNEVERAYSGQRVAINLTNVKKDEIDRGDILAPKGVIRTTHMLDGKFRLLKSSKRELENWTRLRLYHGSKEVLCRLVLLDRDVLKPGEEALVQFRLEEKTACKFGDRFVIRFYSPLETIGGGTILDPNAVKHKRFKENVIDELEMKSKGSSDLIVEKSVERLSKDLPSIIDIVQNSGLGESKVEESLKNLLKDEIIYKISDKFYIHDSYVENKEEQLIRILNDYHVKNPLKAGIKKEEIKSKIFNEVKNKDFDELIKAIVEKKNIDYRDGILALSNFKVVLTSEKNNLKDEIFSIYENSGYKPPNIQEVVNSLKIAKKDMEIINYMQNSGILVKINDNIYLSKGYYDSAKQSAVEFIKENKEISLGEFRDILDTSRKIAVALLEHYDDIKLTKRIDNKRVLY